MIKGSHHTLEIKKQISESHKGKRLSEWQRNKIRKGINLYYNKVGHHFSEEKKERIRKGTCKGMKLYYDKVGHHRTEETKKKISESNKGRIVSEETKRKIGDGNKGKVRSEEAKKKMSEVHKGEKNPSWLGGKSFEPYNLDWTKTLKRSIRERDHYTCHLCNRPGKCIHHIDYNKNNCNPNNLVTLCKSCHMKTNFNRKLWIKFFRNLNFKYLS